MASLSVLPQHLRQRLQRELKPGETLVWAGQPVPELMQKSGYKAWIFFLPWLAISLVVMLGALDFKRNGLRELATFGFLFCVPFVLIGLAGMYTPFWMRRRALSTIYAITTMRALTIDGAKSVSVTSFEAASIQNTEKTVHEDGSGDLVLRLEVYRDSDGDEQTRREGFYGLDDVVKVERLIDKLRQPAATATRTTF